MNRDLRKEFERAAAGARGGAIPENIRAPQIRFWQDRITEMERLWNGSDADLRIAVERYLQYRRQAAEAYAECVRIDAMRGDRRDRPPIPAINELSGMAERILLAARDRAAGVLLSAYERWPTGSLEWLWLLHLMAENGSESLRGIIANLDPHDVSKGIAAENEVMARMLKFMPDGNYDEEAAKAPASFHEEAVKRIAYLGDTYKGSRQSP